jgi:hypothetical protein
MSAPSAAPAPVAPQQAANADPPAADANAPKSGPWSPALGIGWVLSEGIVQGVEVPATLILQPVPDRRTVRGATLAQYVELYNERIQLFRAKHPGVGIRAPRRAASLEDPVLRILLDTSLSLAQIWERCNREIGAHALLVKKQALTELKSRKRQSIENARAKRKAAKSAGDASHQRKKPRSPPEQTPAEEALLGSAADKLKRA